MSAMAYSIRRNKMPYIYTDKTKFYYTAFWLLVGLVLGFIVGCLAMPLNTWVYKKDIASDTLTIKVLSVSNDLNDKDSKSEPYSSLVDTSVYREIKRQGIHHADIVLAQAKLETGNFTSNVCLSYNNLFGLRKPDGSYYKFDKWQSSVKAYKDWVQSKYVPPNDYYDFLEEIGYAEDKEYINKLKEFDIND